MNTPTTAPQRVREFVARLAVHFDDLPERDRAELLEDLEAHLLEVAAEGVENLDAELTSADAYAAELRRSAGFGDPVRTLRQRMRRLAHAGWPPRHPWAVAVLSFLPQLRPAWWVLRAWVFATYAALAVSGGDWWDHVPVPGRNPLGLAVLLAAVAASVRIGLAGRDSRRIGRAADFLLGACAVVLAGALLATSPVRYVDLASEVGWQPPVLRHPDGEPITNLYLFDVEGHPVEDVLVFDGAGRPVEIGRLEDAGFPIESVVQRDAGGNPVPNLYPLEQYTVEHDEAGEPIRRRRPAPPVDLPHPERDGAQEGVRPGRGRQ